MAHFIEITAKVRGGETPLRLKLAVASGNDVTAGHSLTNRLGNLLFAVAHLNIRGEKAEAIRSY